MSDDHARRSQRPSPSPRATAGNAAHKVIPKNAADVQKSQLEKLFQDPSKEAYIPKPPKPKTLAPARDMIPNVQGSSAGAGSGEFHVYKQSRRREFERLKMMEDEDKRDKEAAAFREQQEARRIADEEKTAKNRAKRDKKKAKRDKKKSAAKDGKTAAVGSARATNGKDASGDNSSGESDSSADGQEGRKKRRLGQGAPASVLFRGADEKAADDDQPREEEIVVKRVEQAIYGGSQATAPAATTAGISIVDDD